MQRAENSFRVVMFVISEVCVFLTSDKQIGLSSMIVNELRGRLNFPEGKVSVKIYFLNNLKEYLNKQKKSIYHYLIPLMICLSTVKHENNFLRMLFCQTIKKRHHASFLKSFIY